MSDMPAVSEGIGKSAAPGRGHDNYPQIREVCARAEPTLTVRGHDFWEDPLAEVPGGGQCLNVDSRVVVLMRNSTEGVAPRIWTRGQ